ncbi:hypothetical protein Tco_0341167 [Tanacetum coccineum]
MLCKPKLFYDEKTKVAIGYKNPLCLTRAKQAQSALYNRHVLVTTNHTPTVIHDSEDTREIAETTRKRMLNLTPEQIFWSIDENDRKKAETSVPKPILALTVYPPNTPVKLVPRVLPTISQIKNLEHQIQEKDNVIRDLKVLVANVNDRSCDGTNAKDVTALIEQNKCVRVELEKLRSKVSCFTNDSVKPKVLAPDMYAIDVKPISYPFKNNRSTYITYINHLKESVETVREIVEEARVVKPLDNALNYACRYTKISQELLEYVIGTCPKSFNERDNKAPSTPVTRKKQVTFNDKPGTSSSNTQKHKVHQNVQQTNVPMIHSIGVKSSTEASGSTPRSNTKKNRILLAKTKNKKKVEDHPRTNKLSVQCRTGHPLVSGLRLFKTYDGESFKAQELCGKVHRDRKFCDSDLKVAYRKHSCFVRDINGADLLKGSRSTNLYTISIDDMMKSSPICLLSKASNSKSWL